MEQVGIHYVMWIGCLVGYRDKQTGQYVYAKNASQLHDEAKVAVRAFCKEHKHYPIHGEFFPCPSELAAKAEWSIEKAS
jgi:hypothetical protein